MLFSGIPLGRQLEIDSRSLALAFRGLFWVTILLCLFAFVVRYREYSAVPAQNGASLSAVFDLFTLTGHSFWPFVSAFVLLPLIWQFGDTSNWHRLGDVKLSPDLHNDGPDDNPDIRHAVSKNDRLILWSGFRRFALQSPFTILLPLIIGLLLQASILPIDANNIFDIIFALPDSLVLHDLIGQLAGILFVIAVLAIMFSTVDSLLATSVFVLIYDAYPKTRQVIDLDSLARQEGDAPGVDREESDRLKRRAIIGATGIIIVSLLMFYTLRATGVDPVNLLFGAFSAQVALAPVVFLTLIYKRCSRIKVMPVLAIAGGFLAGLTATAFPSLALVQPLVAFLVSGGLLLCGVCVVELLPIFSKR